MFIKSLSLKNFKKHSDLEIEFSNKLNILHGANSAGKSCVIEAIKYLFFNEGKDIRKEGTKKTIITGILDSGVKISRIRSASINAYELEVNGETKRFDAVGKTIPDEVKEAMQVSTISIDNEEIILNIADQISLPFLLSESPTFRSKLFNKLTGSNLIDKTLQSFNKDILKISRESKSELEHLEKQKTSLSEVTLQKDKLESLYVNFKKQFEKIKILQERYEQLEILKNKIEANYCDLQEVNHLLTTIKTIPNELPKELNKKIIKLEKYKEIFIAIGFNNDELKDVKKQLSSLKIVDIDTGQLKEKIERLDKMKKFYSQLFKNEQVTIDLSNEIKVINQRMKEANKEYRIILKKYGKCPICKSDITEEILKGIKL